ncbi:ketopantoate reductase family protein [Variovorax sp. YR216]|uniref:ketopantoate reductase family protein n=1 Tax=Variovorax sp. YR216 TaxID=1882828 RepID=UPI00089BB3B0|nr:2-dehydropantoate 2-reductase [Variovorax sp. YR216]SEB25741.1 ketopantoate reductase [Variovorax sp. YR216]
MAERDRPPRVLVLGTGAIGSLYGAMLARSGAEVSVVSRSDRNTVREQGIRIYSTQWGDGVFRPARVLDSPGQAGKVADPPDYLWVALKAVRGVDRCALIRSAIGPRTAIVLVGNGIGIEEDIAAAFPQNELVSVLAFVAATRAGPAEVRHHALGRLAMGCYPAGTSAAVERLAQLFAAVGVPCDVQADITASRWLKNLWNVAFNPISVLGGAMDTRTILAPPQGREFVRRVMQEAAAVAAANGYPIAESVIEDTLRSTAAMPAYKTSMAADFEAGRELEVEPILGNVVRSAREHGVSAPSLESLYALMCMVQARPSPAGA